ncbi:NAD(P)H-binding protein [Asanoa iriomotensis]|nr:NAD(P)H-binding protein [Asanoa iriomotensis]
MPQDVLVTGARGKTGREVVRQLHDLTVRAGSSKPDAAPSRNVRPVAFDWHDPATWPAAIHGADAVYLMRPDLPDAPRLVAGLVDLNPEAHVVLLSEQGAAGLTPDHWVRQVEAAVTDRAATWTLLRPSWFHQVLTDPRFYRDSIRDDRVLGLPSGGAPIAWVDARDIAAVAVAALRAPADHQGQAYTLTGPGALTVEAVAAALSARLPQPVRADDPPRQQALNGLDPWTADLLDDIYDRVERGEFGELSNDVEKVTGRQPIAVAEFIDTHLGHWVRR